MYQSEALWIAFRHGGSWNEDYPCAVKIAAGKINAVTGEPWSATLNRHPQDYLVAPKQPWLDGFSVEKGTIRQFVATPLGEGFTAEEQLTVGAEWGGLQLLVYPMRAEAYERLRQLAVYASVAERGVSRRLRCPTWAWRPAAGCARSSTPTPMTLKTGTNVIALAAS